MTDDPRHALAEFLRIRRTRLRPEDVGLEPGPRRRVAGLRREELALLAGLSVDYVTRLEQGRSSHPSAQVLAAIARALRLTEEERDYLFQVAGHAPPDTGRISGHLTPGVHRLLDRMQDTPVAVYDAAWTLLAWNRPWAALQGDASAEQGRERSLPWRLFTEVADRRTGPGRVLHAPDEFIRFEASLVADLRVVLARYPRDQELRRLIDDLIAVSPRFAELWEGGAIATHVSDRKTVQHPDVGPITLDCDILTVQGADLRIVAYTAEPGSEAAQKLALLRVIGLQSMA